MLVDEVKIKVKAGHGGKGAVAFSHIKMSLGPTGATGGKGGDVILKAVEDLGALRKYKTEKNFSADDGDDGRSAFRDGNDGEPLILKVPKGSFVRDLNTGESWELLNLDEEIIIAEGGKGGKGNFHFRSSTNTSPKQFQNGIEGESRDILIELKMIADIGLVGLPNVGKSSFLNTFTKAKSKVANYNFTTLEPHLGSYYGLIIADIPGLIEGASEGKGLGHKFLRHIERTKNIFHLLSATSDDIMKDYEVIKKELKSFNKDLLDKKETIVITKCDEVDSGRLHEIQQEFDKIHRRIHFLSLLDEKSIKEMESLLNKFIS